MTDFLSKIYSIDNIIIYLVVAIAILVVLFVVVLLTGKKDQKLEETKKLEALNNDLGAQDAFKVENPAPAPVETTPMPEKYPDILIQNETPAVPEPAPVVEPVVSEPIVPEMPNIEVPLGEVEKKDVTIPFESVNETPILAKEQEKPLIVNPADIPTEEVKEPVPEIQEPAKVDVTEFTDFSSIANQISTPETPVVPEPVSVVETPAPVEKPVVEPAPVAETPVIDFPQIPETPVAEPTEVSKEVEIELPPFNNPFAAPEEPVVPEVTPAAPEPIPVVETPIMPEVPISSIEPVPQIFTPASDINNQVVEPVSVEEPKEDKPMEITDLPNLPSDEEEEMELPILKGKGVDTPTITPDLSSIPTETYDIK